MTINNIANYNNIVNRMQTPSVSTPSAGSTGANNAQKNTAEMLQNIPAGSADTQINADGDTYEKMVEENSKECQTCKNRKYQDGSDEMVSFKAPAHVSPQAAAGAVRAHEQEHVANAYKKADESGGKVIRASVQIHTAICPECGRSYVAGGTTNTQIVYTNEKNPYQQTLKSQDAGVLIGLNLNAVG